MTDHDHDEQTVADTSAPTALAVTGLPEFTRDDLTIEDILDMAKTPEKRARVCLRADLQAEYDSIVTELSTLVDAQGKVIADDDAAVGDATPAQRAAELEDRAQRVRREMLKSMWTPLFRGLTSDDLATFNREHAPKGDNPDMTEYNTALVAACAVKPVLSVEDVRRLRTKLGSRAVGELVNTANWVCSRGGIDVPK